jgi:predicted trehalose synthase
MRSAAFSDESALLDYVRRQRWFGARSREPVGAEIADSARLPGRDVTASIVLVRVRFVDGSHELYQLVSDDSFDALAEAVREGASLVAEHGSIEFRGFPERWPAVTGPARRIGAEQSNTSAAFGDEVILKIFRRLQEGENPELEMLRFLTEHRFENVPPLLGWYRYGGDEVEATLGVAQTFVPHAVDGWDLALAEVARSPERFLTPLHRLGEVTAALHNALGSDRRDPRFRPEPVPAAVASRLAESLAAEVVEAGLAAQAPRLEPPADAGTAIRTHGDYHLGQVLWAEDDWFVVDFEGEPARPIPDRRRRHSPLRDVAGMLRSLAYVAAAAPILKGVEVPSAWEDQARASFLDGYLASVDADLLPVDADSISQLERLFELEKALYELRYERDHRPDWIDIPAAGIRRLLA